MVATPLQVFGGGTIQVTVKAFGITVATGSYDVCSQVVATGAGSAKCPLPANVPFNGQISYPIPAAAPVGVPITLHVKIIDQTGNEWGCFDVSGMKVSSGRRLADLLLPAKSSKHYGGQGKGISVVFADQGGHNMPNTICCGVGVTANETGPEGLHVSKGEATKTATTDNQLPLGKLFERQSGLVGSSTKPSGAYKGFTNVPGHEGGLGYRTDASLTIDDAVYLDFSITKQIYGGSNQDIISCQKEAYSYTVTSYNTTATIDLPNMHKNGDCISEKIGMHGVTIDGINYDTVKDEITMSVSSLGLPVEFTLTKADDSSDGHDKDAKVAGGWVHAVHIQQRV
eukprot:g5652.t1